MTDPDDWADGEEEGDDEDEEEDGPEDAAVPVSVVLRAGPKGHNDVVLARLFGSVGVDELEACLEAKGKEGLVGRWEELKEEEEEKQEVETRSGKEGREG